MTFLDEAESFPRSGTPFPPQVTVQGRRAPASSFHPTLFDVTSGVHGGPPSFYYPGDSRLSSPENIIPPNGLSNTNRLPPWHATFSDVGDFLSPLRFPEFSLELPPPRSTPSPPPPNGGNLPLPPCTPVCSKKEAFFSLSASGNLWKAAFSFPSLPPLAVENFGPSLKPLFFLCAESEGRSLPSTPRSNVLSPLLQYSYARISLLAFLQAVRK